MKRFSRRINKVADDYHKWCTYVVRETICDCILTPCGSSVGLIHSDAPSLRACSNFKLLTSMANIRLALRALEAFKEKEDGGGGD